MGTVKPPAHEGTISTPDAQVQPRENKKSGTTLLPGQRKRGTVPAYYSTADVLHLLMINPYIFPRSIFPKPLPGIPCLH